MFDLRSRTIATRDEKSRQTVRLGASLEFARAVLAPTATTRAVVEIATRFFFLLMAVAVLVLSLALMFGWVWVGLIAVVMACAVDALATLGGNRDALLMHRLRADTALRCFVYITVFAALLARSGVAHAVDPVIVLGIGGYGTHFFYRVAARWLARRQPPMRYVPQAAQADPLPAFARVYQRAMLQPLILITTELAALVAVTSIAVAGHRALSWYVVFAAGLVMVTAALANFRIALRLGSAENVEALTADLSRFLDDLAPTHVTYMSAGAGQSKYILNQWIPVIEKVSDPGFIIVREASNLGPIQHTSLPVVHAAKTRHVEELTSDRVDVAYYLANAGKNVHLLREAAMKHVFLNHGDSDKSTSANPVSRVYDEVWVAGQAAIDRYEAAGISIPPKNYAIVGRPQMASLTVGPILHERRTLLYAPTFEGYYEESNYSSLERMGPEMIRFILSNYPELRIIFKPHPNTGVERPGMIAARVAIAHMLANGDHLFIDPTSPVTLYEAFDESDLMISDVSSVVTDYLFTERPVIVCNPVRLPLGAFLNTFPTQKSSYVLDGDLTNLGAVLDDALGEDSLRSDRIANKKYVLGDLPQGPLEAFVAESERVRAESVAHAATIANRFRIAQSDSVLDQEEEDREDMESD